MIWKNTNCNWCRYCPCCNTILVYTGEWAKSRATKQFKNKTNCHSCSVKGDRNPFFGRQHSETFKNSMKKRKVSDETRRKIREKKIGVKLSPITILNLKESIRQAWQRPDSRKKYLNALSKTKWIKVRVDIGQLELLEKWNKLGFNFEPNFQLKTDFDLFYLDGYDKGKNVVLECDSSYHKKPLQHKKDLIRQQTIINILKPKKFWRYNTQTQIIKNVIER